MNQAFNQAFIMNLTCVLMMIPVVMGIVFIIITKNDADKASPKRLAQLTNEEKAFVASMISKKPLTVGELDVALAKFHEEKRNELDAKEQRVALLGSTK
jgi:flagellar basal body-associated protein FliL